MKHFGDITMIDGHEVPIIDVIVGGSPCQDLSVAGKREGLAGQRSGLFMDQIRVIKEMHDECRRANVDIRPRYMVWENVPGAFSSNGGADFQAVLEETAKVAERDACIPRLEKWPPSGCIMGDGWSIAWRVHDAQFWGVPQRRKRISLVADFRGGGAPEILFERKSLSRDIEKSESERERDPSSIRNDSYKTICYRKKSHPINEDLPQNWEEADINDTLNAFDNSEFRTPTLIVQNNYLHGNGFAIESHPKDSRYQMNNDDVNQTLTSCMGHDAAHGGLILFEPRSQDGVPRIHGNIVPTLNTAQGGQRQPCICDGDNMFVRRLTPLECERLQGFPDGWTDIGDWIDSKGRTHKGESDAPRYKALGNSIALPFWAWLAKRMVAQLKQDGVEHPTMASLFDGIGGFPLVFSRAGCDPVWASEIEEFPIAVTKIRFPEEE